MHNKNIVFLASRRLSAICSRHIHINRAQNNPKKSSYANRIYTYVPARCIYFPQYAIKHTSKPHTYAYRRENIARHFWARIIFTSTISQRERFRIARLQCLRLSRPGRLCVLCVVEKRPIDDTQLFGLMRTAKLQSHDGTEARRFPW